MFFANERAGEQNAVGYLKAQCMDGTLATSPVELCQQTLSSSHRSTLLAKTAQQLQDNTQREADL